MLHVTVGLFLPTKETQCQGRVRACRGDPHWNIFTLNWRHFGVSGRPSFSGILLSRVIRFTFQPQKMNWLFIYFLIFRGPLALLQSTHMGTRTPIWEPLPYSMGRGAPTPLTRLSVAWEYLAEPLLPSHKYESLILILFMYKCILSPVYERTRPSANR